MSDWRVPLGRSLLGLLILAWSTLAWAEQTEVAEDAESTLAAAMGIQGPLSAEEIPEFLQEAFGPDVSGASQYVGTRKLLMLAPREVALGALQKNLSIQVSRHEAERVRRAIQEAEAVFNPVFRVSVDYSQSRTHERTRLGTVFVRAFLPLPFPSNDEPILCTPFGGGFTPTIVNGVPVCRLIPAKGVLNIPPSPFRTDPQVVLLGFLQDGGGLRTVPIRRSQKDPNDPVETFTYTLGLDQQLPWGAALQLSAITTDRDVFYNARGDSYDRDFATSLALDLALPLPFSRQFGPYAPAETGIMLAEKAAERADWDLRTAINTTLAVTDVVYWELVRALEGLRLVIENRRLVEQEVARTAGFFERGLTTAYGLAQVEAELARLKVQEEAARNTVITAANTLATLVERSGEATAEYLFLPSGYDQLLESLLPVDGLDPVATALAQRPDLRAEQVSREASEIAVAFARQQVRPDYGLLISVNSAQDGSEIGYKNIFDSYANLADPDKLTQSYTLGYNLPLGNRALKAQLTQAEKRHEDQTVAIRDLENTIVRDVRDALSGLHSARTRLEIAERNVTYAETAFSRLESRRAAGGDVRELELISKSRELLNAKAARLSAQIDNKIAETQLLVAQGVIAAQYPSVVASNDFDRQRVQLLTNGDELRYFAPLEGEAGPAGAP